MGNFYRRRDFRQIQSAPSGVIVIIFLLVLGTVQWSGAQTIVASGAVRNDLGAAIANVQVLERGTGNSVLTNAAGNFTITVADDAILVFTAAGYQVRELPAYGNVSFVSLYETGAENVFHSRGNGNWESTSTWSFESHSSPAGTSAPSITGTHVVIKTGHTINFNTSAGMIGDVWVQPGATLNINNRSFTAFGNVRFDGTVTNIGNVDVPGFFTASFYSINNTLNFQDINIPSGATLNMHANAIINGTVNNSGGTFNITGQVCQPNSSSYFPSSPYGDTGSAFSNITGNSVTLTWTAPSDGKPTIIVAKQGTSANQPTKPVCGQSYNANLAFGSGSDVGASSFVVYKGTGTSATITGLSANTDYVFSLFAYTDDAGGCYSLMNYNIQEVTTAAPAATFTQITNGLASSPLYPGTTNQAIYGYAVTASGTTNLTALSFQIGRNPGTDFSNYKIVRSVDNSFTTGGDNTVLAGLVFTVGAATIDVSGINEPLSATPKNYFLVVDIGAGVSAATPNNSVWMNHSGIGVSQGNVNTFSLPVIEYAFSLPSATQPGAQPTSLVFSGVTVDEITGTFTAATGSPSGYVVIAKTGSAPSAVPVDGTDYVVGQTLGDGTVISIGASLSFTHTGLAEGVTYHYAIYSYNAQSGYLTNYLTTSPLRGSQATQAAPSITSVTPDPVCAGENVTITGTNFGGSIPTVNVGKTPVAVLTHSATQIVFEAPETTGGLVEVVNNDSDLSGTSVNALVINEPIDISFGVTVDHPNVVIGGAPVVALASSQVSVVYQLREVSPGTNTVGSPVTGTGSSLQFAIGGMPDAGTFVYEIYATRPGCASTSMAQTASVDVRQLSLSLETSHHICLGEAVTLGGVPTVSGGSGSYTVAWTSDPAGFTSDNANPEVSPTLSTTYNLKVTDNSYPGSPVVAVVQVNVNTPPADVTITGSPTFCRNAVDAIYAATNIANVSYEWQVPAGATFSQKGVNEVYIDFGTQAGDIKVTPFYPSTGCRGKTAVLSVTPSPDPTTFAVSGSGVYCTGTPGRKIGLSGSQAGVQYTVYRNNVITAMTAAGTGSALEFATPVTEAGTFTIVAETAAGCRSQMGGQAVITVSNSPSSAGGTITGITTMCTGISGEYTVTGFANVDQYEWQLPAGFELVSQTGTKATIKAASGPGGTINVVGVNTCGTGGNATVAVSILAAPEVTIESPKDVFINEPAAFAFSSSVPVQVIQWTFGDGGSADETDPVYTYAASGQFNLTLDVEDDNGCPGSSEKLVTVLPEAQLTSYSIRNVITANGDEKNKYLFIDRIEKFPGSEVILLDRLGVEIFRKQNYTNDWDVSSGSGFIPAGNYVCVVRHDGKVYSRSVTVLKAN